MNETGEIMSNDNIIIDNLDRKLGKEIYNSLKEIITKYPRLNNTICLVSDIDYLVNYLNNNYEECNCIYENDDKTIMTTASMYLPKKDKNLNYYDSILYYKPDFIGIGVNRLVKYKNAINTLKSDYANEWCYSRNIKDTVYHEIGHIFSKIFKLTSNPKMLELLEGNLKNNKTLSTYSKINYEELIAECFSKYSYNPSYSELVYIIGRIIENYYLKFEDTELFDISNKKLIKNNL